MFLLCMFLLIIVVLKLTCNSKLVEWGFTIKPCDLTFDEQLAPFYKGLKESQR